MSDEQPVFLGVEEVANGDSKDHWIVRVADFAYACTRVAIPLCIWSSLFYLVMFYRSYPSSPSVIVAKWILVFFGSIAVVAFVLAVLGWLSMKLAPSLPRFAQRPVFWFYRRQLRKIAPRWVHSPPSRSRCSWNWSCRASLKKGAWLPSPGRLMRGPTA